MRYGLFRMTPLWIYQQRRSGLRGHKLCYRTCRGWVACVVNRQYVSSKAYVSLKGGCMLLLSSPSLFVAVSSIATRRHFLHRYQSLRGFKSLVGSIKFVSWVEGKKMGKNGPQNLSWTVFVTYFMGLPVFPRIFPSPITPSSENDPLTSLQWKGVWLASVLRLWGLAFGPTSIKGGEGLQVGGCVRSEGCWGGEGAWWWWWIEDKPTSTVMRLMSIKTPLAPSKIIEPLSQSHYPCHIPLSRCDPTLPVSIPLS